MSRNRGFAPGIVRPSAALYAPNGVVFDGTNDFLTRGSSFSGLAIGKQLTLVTWLDINSMPVGFDYLLLHMRAATNSRIIIRIFEAGALNIFGRNPTGATILDADTTTFTFSAGIYRLAVTIDMTSQAATKCWIDEVEQSLTFSTFTNDNLDLDADNSGVMNHADGSSAPFDGEVADYWLDDRVITSGDLSKFFTGAGCLAWKGDNGELPFSATPVVYLSGPTANWPDNLGSGGALTLTGALGTSGTPPCGGPL